MPSKNSPKVVVGSRVEYVMIDPEDGEELGVNEIKIIPQLQEKTNASIPEVYENTSLARAILGKEQGMTVHFRVPASSGGKKRISTTEEEGTRNTVKLKKVMNEA